MKPSIKLYANGPRYGKNLLLERIAFTWLAETFANGVRNGLTEMGPNKKRTLSEMSGPLRERVLGADRAEE